MPLIYGEKFELPAVTLNFLKRGAKYVFLDIFSFKLLVKPLSSAVKYYLQYLQNTTPCHQH